MRESKGLCALRKPIPILAFTMPQALMLDFDCFRIESTVKICTTVSKEFRCGDVLIILSNSTNQKNLYGEKMYHLHAVFGARLTFEYIHVILKMLSGLRIIELLFMKLHELEGDLTLRVAPKKIGEPIPRPIIYIKIDGRREIIDKYLEYLEMGKKIYTEVCLVGKS